MNTKRRECGDETHGARLSSSHSLHWSRKDSGTPCIINPPIRLKATSSRGSKGNSTEKLTSVAFLSSFAFLVSKGVLSHMIHAHDIHAGIPRERFPQGEPTETSKQPIRTRYLGHVTSYQGPVFLDSVGSANYKLQLLRLLLPNKTRLYVYVPRAPKRVYSRTPIYRDPRGKGFCPVNRGARYIGVKYREIPISGEIYHPGKSGFRIRQTQLNNQSELVI
eukprot:sb/3469830/